MSVYYVYSRGVHTRSITMTLSNIILILLRSEKGRVSVTKLFYLVGNYYKNNTKERSPSQPQILHAVDLLSEDGFVIKTISGNLVEFQISNKGYGKLRSWYAPKKMLSIISNDLAKMLSIVATALSILATFLSIKARY